MHGKIRIFFVIVFLGLLVSAALFYPKLQGFVQFLQQRSQLQVGSAADTQPAVQTSATFVGSSQCVDCHEEQYQLWKSSRHSKMIQDAQLDPAVIIGNFETIPEEADFKKSDIAYTVGSKYKQRYMIRHDRNGEEDYRMGNYQWNEEMKRWYPYKTYKKKWYKDYFEHSNEGLPTSKVCDGCHFVGFLSTGKRVEPAIACESCHGPGSVHVDDPTNDNIYRVSTDDPKKATEVCLQCHLRNRDKRLETQSPESLKEIVVDYPLGYEPGKPLMAYKMPAPFSYGHETGEFYANGVGKKSRTQGNEYVRSMMYRHGVSCANCHNPHALDETSDNNTGNQLCMNCHQFGSLIGPHDESLEQHTRHKADSNGSLCVECHMPKVAKNTGKSPVSVRTHVFGFIYPEDTRKYKVPNACTSCHDDKSLDWAEGYLKDWGMMNWY